MQNTITRNQNGNAIYPIFLSSHYSEISFPPSSRLKQLREQVFIEAGQEKYIYVDEKVYDRKIVHYDPIEVVDELVKRIREARTFICILGGENYGSLIDIRQSQSSVSYFEIEIFQAAILKKPVYIFIRKGYNQHPREKKLLELLRFYLPEWVSNKELTDADIIDQIKRIVANERMIDTFGDVPHLFKPIRRLVQGLSTYRSKHSVHSEVSFLNGEFETRSYLPRLEVVQNIIDMIRNETNEEKKLSRLWIGIREIMSSRYDKECDLELLQYWNVLLDAWAKAGAWYRLHGDIPLGCLAALNSMVEVRYQIDRQYKGKVNTSETMYPGGPLSSSKYSIAKHLYVKSDRKKRFSEALSDIKKALDQPEQKEADLRAIQASIYLELGAKTEYITEYEKVLQLRQLSGADEAAIGEAMSELGFAYIRVFRLRRGLSYCEEGVKLLANRHASFGFLTRGLKKLGYAYLLNGKFLKAYDTFHKAKELATKYGIVDQL